MAEDKCGKKMIAVNREVRHEYFVIEALETGIELVGTEVKSLRAGGVNLKDSWADIDDGELIAKGIHISPYEQGNIFNKDPRRPRRLLAHKAEIRRLSREAGLFTWDKPAYACLATRIRTGEEITLQKLKQTEKAEGFLFGLGFRDFRVRMVGNTAKLELREADLPLLLENREKIVTELRKDYDSVLLNLEVRK